MILVLFPVVLLLKKIEVDKDNTYYSSQDGVLYNKDQTELIILPIANNNYNIPLTVTRIGDSAFERNAMTEISLPDSVSYIGKSAFCFCDKLESIEIPKGVTEISYLTFFQCKGLNKVTLPLSVKVISGLAFSSCTNLKNITYNGTKADWYQIKLKNLWNAGCPEITVTCTAEPGDNKTLTIKTYLAQVLIFDRYTRL